ncbi:MAG: beta-(1-6) glucans synthase, partial [Pseudolabrys sp.]
AFDEPWKRALEGTVGGHWGLLDDTTRAPKFVWGEAVANHPLWRWQAAGGILFALGIFGAGFAARRNAEPSVRWLAVTANAIAGGTLIGWSIANVPIESVGLGGWLRSIAYAAVAFLTPPVLSAAVMRGVPLPRFSRLLGPAAERVRDPLTLAVGALMIATTLLAIMAALGLVFDPRYRDFPFAPLTAAIVPLFVHSASMPRPIGRHGVSEWVAAGVLGLSVPYIALNESFANWQSLWLCAALVALAFSLFRLRDVQS